MLRAMKQDSATQKVWQAISDALRAVADAHENSWERLLVLLQPEVESLARFQPIGRLRLDEDAMREIVVKVIARLHAGEHRAIKKLFALDSPPNVRAWIRVVVRSAAIDVMRAQPEFLRGNKETAPAWISLDTIATQDGVKTPDSLVEKQKEVEAFMAHAQNTAREMLSQHGDETTALLATQWNVPLLHARRFVKKIDLYTPVLSMVLAGHSYVHIAERLDVSRREVELLVGYIEEFFHARGFAA